MPHAGNPVFWASSGQDPCFPDLLPATWFSVGVPGRTPCLSLTKRFVQRGVLMRSVVSLAMGVAALAALAGQARSDTVTDWNFQTLEAIRLTGTPPPRASRSLGIVSVSVYDAINSIDRTHQPYLVNTVAGAG